MVSVKRITAAFTALIIMLTAFPAAFAADRASAAEYVNSDVEGYYGGLYYFASNEYSHFAYRETAINENRQYLTSYPVSEIAVASGFAYVLSGNDLNRINVTTLEEQRVYSSRAGIDRFAIGGGTIYLLMAGGLFTLNTCGNSLDTVIPKGGIKRFWLESASLVCYMTDSKYVYKYDVATGQGSREYNFVSALPSGPSEGAQSASMELGALMRKFPQGKYWNHIGSSSNNPNGYTSSPCTHHSGNCDYNGGCGCNSFGSAIQCMGYAHKCAYDVYGSYVSGWAKYTSSSAIGNVKAGDVIRYRNDGHSIFVTGVNGDTVTYTDCNSDNHCIIKWNRTASKSTLRASFTYLRSAPYEAPGNTSENPEYTITFNANGGTVQTATMTVKGGDTYGELPVPEREGYDFDGWFTDAEGGSKIESTDKPGASAVFYAHWTIKTYYITFDKNGGNYAPDDFSKIYGESKVIANRTPSRDGYTFLYWNTAPDGSGTSYKPGATYYANETVTLHAIWQGKQIQVRFDANSGWISGSNYKTVVMGDPYGELPVPNRDGYDFTGWHIGSESGTLIKADTAVDVPSSHVLVASWKIKTYTVTFNANGGSGAPESQTKTHGTSITLTKAVPTRAHYGFTGWYTSPDGTGTKYEPGSVYTANADLDLYAGWLGEKYTVKFNANGGENPPASFTKTHGTSVTLTKDIPEKTGCTFVEWNTKQDGSGSGFKAGGKYTYEGNVTLWAIWEITKYMVSYDSQGAESGPSNQIFEYDGSVEISEKVPVKTGHIFRGWFTQPGGEGEEYKAGQTYAQNADLTLYALWEKEKYLVSYELNGGTGSIDSAYKEYGTPLLLTSSVPKRPGYDFMGWALTADATQAAYPAGGTYTENAPVTLYACWSPATFIVYFDSNGSSDPDTSARFTYNTVYRNLPTVTRNGYKFAGWYTKSTGGAKISEGDRVLITENTVFYAHWTANKYVITFDAGEGVSPVNTKEVSFGSAYGELPVPVREGYVFAGWFSPDGREVTEQASVISAQDETLTAAWSQGTYTVAFNPGEGSCGTVSIQVGCGQPLPELPGAARDGFDFEGWADENGKVFAAGDLMPAGNLELYAVYTAKTFNISLNPGNGSVSVRSIPVTYGKAVSNLPDAKDGDGLFAGWFTVGGTQITKDTVYSYVESITVTAKYVPLTEGSVTFIADGEVKGVLPASSLPANEPAVPAKAGYEGSWSSYDNKAAAYAVYTPCENTLTLNIGSEKVTESAASGSALTLPEDLPVPEGYAVTGWEPALPAVMPGQDAEFTAVLTPVEYTAYFISGGSAEAVTYTVQGCEAPAVPEKAGYDRAWQDFTPQAGGMTVFARYTPISYIAEFTALGRSVKKISYTVETDSIKLPGVPQKNGYTGRWPDFELTPGGITVDAVYTPNTYYVTFIADKEAIGKVAFLYGASSVEAPAVPVRDGYTAAWEKYTLDCADITVKAVYTPITYTATFIAGSRVIARVPFTLESPPAPPSIPSRTGYTARWSEYTVAAADMTVNAIYIPISEVYILGYTSPKKIDYMTTITFRANVVNPPDDCELRWLINGADAGTGNGDGTFTVEKAKKDFTISAYVVSNGEKSEPSKEETVDVNTTFFARIIGFFRQITGRLHTVVQ